MVNSHNFKIYTHYAPNLPNQNTGSNGNAGPVSADGLAVDPAAQTYLKQIVSITKDT